VNRLPCPLMISHGRHHCPGRQILDRTGHEIAITPTRPRARPSAGDQDTGLACGAEAGLFSPFSFIARVQCQRGIYICRRTISADGQHPRLPLRLKQPFAMGLHRRNARHHARCAAVFLGAAATSSGSLREAGYAGRMPNQSRPPALSNQQRRAMWR